MLYKLIYNEAKPLTLYNLLIVFQGIANELRNQLVHPTSMKLLPYHT